jgi:NADH-quinone oxidoreductase subunit G
MQAAERSEEHSWENLDDIVAALAEAMPGFRSIPEIAPPAGFRVAGQRIPRQPGRYSGRTAMRAHLNVHEPKPPEDPDSPLAFSMEGYPGQPPAPLIPRFWAPGWNSVQALNKFQSEVGGPLREGDPGRRLIEPAPVEEVAYFRHVPPPFKPQGDEWLVIPIYHIFGSEELSILTPGIAARAPQPYVGLNPHDAAGLRVQEGGELALHAAGAVYRLPVKLMPTLPTGMAAVPAGLSGSPGIVLPAWGKLRYGEAGTGGAKR